MSFGGVQFTNQGLALQAKAQTGVELHFTRLAVGDGELGGQSIPALTDLIHLVKSVDITKLKTLPGGKAVVGGILSNQDIAAGFYWRELGLFATDPDIGELLYCYGNAGVLAEYIPAPGGAEILEKQINIVALVGNAQNITATIEQSLIFATVQDLANHTDDEDIHITAEERTAWNSKETPAGAQAKVDAHASNTNNPHNVTAAQVGAETPAGVQAKVDAHADDVATINALGHVKHAVLTTTLNTTWSGSSAPFSKVQSVSGILSTDTPIVDVVMSGTFSTDEARAEAWGHIYRITIANGSITLYAKEKPTVSLPLQIKVVR
jgi:hypothetical protein